MKKVGSVVSNFYTRHKTVIMIAVLVLAMAFIAGCASSQGTPPPAGPIGGGCG